jgi:hypothetical protein
MKSDTLKRLNDSFERFPSMRAHDRVEPHELDEAARDLGVPLSSNYCEFVIRFGGGHAGAYAVAGLRRWETAGKGEWSIIEMTQRHRAQGWPGTKDWAVFSNDGFGNPIALDVKGHVWLSDHDCRECVCLEADFEDWLRRWALNIEPLRGTGYLDRWNWPDRSDERP